MGTSLLDKQRIFHFLEREQGYIADFPIAIFREGRGAKNTIWQPEVLIAIWFKQMSRSTTKPTKWYVRPVKTQINLGIRPVWSESLLSAWRNHKFLASHWAHSDNWSDRANAQADLSLRWAHRSFCWFCHAVGQKYVVDKVSVLWMPLVFTHPDI